VRSINELSPGAFSSLNLNRLVRICNREQKCPVSFYLKKKKKKLKVHNSALLCLPAVKNVTTSFTSETDENEQ
jgi:hypothetical protein